MELSLDPFIRLTYKLSNSVNSSLFISLSCLFALSTLHTLLIRSSFSWRSILFWFLASWYCSCDCFNIDYKSSVTVILRATLSLRSWINKSLSYIYFENFSARVCNTSRLRHFSSSYFWNFKAKDVCSSNWEACDERS